MRPTLDETLMRVAELFRDRGTCARLQVGCIITNKSGTQILAVGYNGNARGLPNRCDSAEAGRCGCIHAEANALLKAPYGDGLHLVMYTTTSPCPACAKLIANSCVRQVFFRELYRDPHPGRHILHMAGIASVHMPAPRPADHAGDMFDRPTLFVGNPDHRVTNGPAAGTTEA